MGQREIISREAAKDANKEFLPWMDTDWAGDFSQKVTKKTK
jgi:hypothetical protein